MSTKFVEYAPYKDGGGIPFPVADINLPYSECYNGNILVKKAFAKTDLTIDHINEIVKCSNDPLYFIENYCRIVSLDGGIVPFKVFEFQRDMVKMFQTDRFSLCLLARQNGKTQIVAAYITWYIIFNPTKTAAILANKGDAAQEIMDRIRLMIENLPFFIQPGVKIYNRRSIELDTGSKIFSSATSSSGIRGRSCVSSDTKIKVRNKITGEIKTLNISEFSSMINKDNTNKTANQTFIKNDEWEVWTPNGWSDFEGVVITHDRDTIKLTNFELECTPCHRINIDGEWKVASELDHIISIKQDVFDLYKVEKKNQYYTNDVISHNCNLVYIDEACFIEKDLEFYTSTYPTVTSGKDTRVIMTSTPRGARGMFYMLWRDAIEKRNSYKTLQADWSARPDRDEDWKMETIANIGYSRFRQEFENSFIGSTGTLVPTEVLETMQWINAINEDEHLKIYQEYNPARRYISISDPGFGVEQDYSVCTVIDVTEYPYKIVAKYRNNQISPLLFPHTIMNISMNYGNCPALVEANNECGGQVTYILYYELEYENTILTSNAEKHIGGLREGGKAAAALPGVRTTKKVKSVGCSNLKTLLENGYIVVEDQETIEELGTFIAKGSSYEADEECHDDTVMPLVLFSWFVKSDHFSEYCGSNVGNDLYKRNTERALADILPFGFILSVEDNIPTSQNIILGMDYNVTENKSMSFDQWMRQ